MPTRTVVFLSLYKFNENKRQILSSSEFLQMSGRAGRRGKDESGNVYIICCHPLGKNQIKKIKDLLRGEGNELESKFRLSYRIILSFYHRSLKNIKDFFEESFHETHNTEVKPEKQKEIDRLKNSIQKKNKINCKPRERDCDIEDSPIFDLIKIINNIDSINKKIFNNVKIIEYINTNPCLILKVKINNNSTINKFHKPDIVMIVNIVQIKNHKKLWCITITEYDENKKEEEIKNNEQINQSGFPEKGEIQEFKYKYVLMSFDDIIEIYDIPKVDKVDTFYQSDKLETYFKISERGFYYFKSDNKSLYFALKQFHRAILNYFPKKLSNIIKNKGKKKTGIFETNKVKTLDYKKNIGENLKRKEITKLKGLKAQLKNNPCQDCPYYEFHLKKAKDIFKEKCQIDNLEKEIEIGEKKIIQKKFNNRISLLEDVQYLKEEHNSVKDIDDTTEIDKLDNFSLTLKGKASLEIITNDNILITELLSTDIFFKNSEIISIQVIVPFLSIFVGNTKTKDLNFKIVLEEQKYNEESNFLISKFYKIYQKLTEKEKKLGLKESVYNRSFSFKFYESVYSWINGNNFCDVCDKYKIVEGKLYHIIIRTFYLAEEIVNFYSKLGSEKLVNIFKEIKDKLLKGIMCVESLYIQEKIDIYNI